MLVFQVRGRGVARCFEHEAGGHRFQRVPPTEKRGRVQTSTITVAVLQPSGPTQVCIEPRDLRAEFVRGSGKGGQHRNKTETCAVVTHVPSGLTVRCDGGRSKSANHATAVELLGARLSASAATASHDRLNRERRGQLGCGARGDKRRTIAVQRDAVTDHLLGRTMPVKQYMRGQLQLLVGRPRKK